MDATHYPDTALPLSPEDFDFTAEYPVTNREINIPHDSPHLLRNEEVALIPKHFERYIELHREYKAGIRISSGNTLGDKLTKHCGFEPDHSPPVSMKSIERLRKMDEAKSKAWKNDSPYSHSIRMRGRPSKKRPRTYMPTEIGKMLGVSAYVVGDWRRRGHIPKELAYGKHGYLADAIDRLIAEGKLPPPITPPTMKTKIPKPVMSKFYNARQVADAVNKHTGLSCSGKTVAQWRRHGHIPAEAIAGKNKYDKSLIDSLLAEGGFPPEKKSSHKKKNESKHAPAQKARVFSSEKIAQEHGQKRLDALMVAPAVLSAIPRICEAIEASIRHTGLTITAISFDKHYNVEHVLLEKDKKYNT